MTSDLKSISKYKILTAIIALVGTLWLGSVFSDEVQLPFMAIAGIAGAMTLGLITGTWTPNSFRKVLYFASIVGLLAMGVGGIFYDTVVFRIIGGLFLGILLGLTFAVLLSNRSYLWLGVGIGGLILAISLPSLIILAIYGIGAVVMLFINAYTNEHSTSHSSFMQFHGDWLINSMLLFMVASASVLIVILVFWLPIFTSRFMILIDKIHLLGVGFGLFGLNLFDINNRLKPSLGLIFSASLLLLFAVGMAFTFSIPLLFAVLFAIAFYISVVGFYQLWPQVSFNKIEWSVLIILVGAINVALSIYMSSYETFLLSIGMPKAYLLKSELQSIVKIAAIPATLMVISSGILFMKRRAI